MDEKKTGEISGVYEPLITIIVPVYQTKPYLCRCVYSLLKQTWKNLEILLVDDGSTDGSGEICEQLRQEDGRIRVIHQENGGLSCARNAGLREASGRYVGFVDSDDRVEPAMYMELVQAAECHDADLVMCDHKRMLKNGDVREVTTSLAAGVYDRDTEKQKREQILFLWEDALRTFMTERGYRYTRTKDLYINLHFPQDAGVCIQYPFRIRIQHLIKRSGGYVTGKFNGARVRLFRIGRRRRAGAVRKKRMRQMKYITDKAVNRNRVSLPGQSK